MKRIFLVAGDPSGDLIASQLVTSLKNLQTNLFVVGVGGQRLKTVSDLFLENIVEQHVLGFAISPKQIFYFRHILNDIIAPEMKKNPPDVVVPVDFYGFNSRVAYLAKSLGVPVFYYASPQFWASRPGRAERLRKVVDLFLCLFPFEVDFYQKRHLPAKFVGHPVLDVIPHLSEQRPTRIEVNIGLLPGSRPEEIERHLPVMLQASNIIKKAHPGTRFMVFTMPYIDHHFYNRLLSRFGEQSNCLIELVEDEAYLWRSQIDLAITASGMETLENALLGIPMVVMYKTNWITYWVARALIQIPYVSMPNLLSGKKIVPEFIQSQSTPSNIAAPILLWLKNPMERNRLREELLILRKKFGETGASDRAARVILEKVA